MRTATQATQGFYRHRIIVTSTTPGHTATIRGLSQSSGTIGTTDTAVQTSSAATTPARFVQWYTSEIPADIYVRITGTGGTTDDYVLDYEVEPVAVTAGPTIDPDTDITITTVGQTSTDTDMWVYDSDFSAIPDFGNDDIFNDTVLQSQLTRSYETGTYYLAISNFNIANSEPSPTDDDWRSGNVLDFPGAIANSSTVDSLPLDPSIDGNSVTVSKEGPFDIAFISFEAEEGIDDVIFANGFECEPGFPGCEAPTCEPLQLLEDPGFETTNPGDFSNAFWASTSTNFGTGLCNEVACGTGGGTAGSNGGDFWVWLGGTAAAETTTVSQTVVIPAGSDRHLNYNLWIGSVSGVASTAMTIQVDGSVVDTIPEPVAAEPGYSQRTVDISAFADGGSHTILFEFVSPGGGPSTPNYSLDDVTLECEPPAP